MLEARKLSRYESAFGCRRVQLVTLRAARQTETHATTDSCTSLPRPTSIRRASSCARKKRVARYGLKSGKKRSMHRCDGEGVR